MKFASVAAVLLFALACGEHGTEAADLLARGIQHRERGEYARAIKAYDSALVYDPTSASAYSNRGLVYQLVGNYNRSIEDFDQAISLRPDFATAIKNRGRSELYLGEFEKAAADLRKGLSYDSTNTYTVIALHIAMRGLGRDDSTEFAAQLQRTDSTRWPAPVARYLLGTLTADELMAAARTVSDSVMGDQECASAYYIGEKLVWSGSIDAARARFQHTIDRCPKRWSEFHGATAALKRLDSMQK